MQQQPRIRVIRVGRVYDQAQRQPLTLLTAARRADISEAAVLAEQLLDAETGAR